MSSDALLLHGGDLATASARYGGAVETWLDLSTGINPVPWPGVATLPMAWDALPSPAALAALEAAAAAHFGVDPAHVCAVPGSELGLRLLGSLLGGHALHDPVGYRTHGEMFGPAPRQSPAHRVLANPCNPEGTLLDRAALAGLLAAQRRAGTWLIVDEAFADSATDASIADRIADRVPLVVTRSFGKFFGLAGVRLGFVLGPTPLLGQLRARMGSWPVSAAAIAIGTAAYRDRRWIAEARTALPARAAELDRLLAAHGLTARGICPLFRLVETADAMALFERLARNRILTRRFAARPRWLRLGVPADADARARLARALADG